MGTERSPEPLGMLIHRVARALERAFEASLAGSGASRSWWLILRTLRDGQAETQVELAAVVGLRGATLTHRLDALEEAGLVSRVTNPRDRRNHTVTLTPAGKQKFDELLNRVKEFDARLRKGVSAEAEDALRKSLRGLEANVAVEGNTCGTERDDRPKRPATQPSHQVERGASRTSPRAEMNRIKSVVLAAA